MTDDVDDVFAVVLYEHRIDMQPIKLKCELVPKLSIITWYPCCLEYCRPAVKVKTPAELQAQVACPASFMRLLNYYQHAETEHLPSTDWHNQTSYLCHSLPFTLKHQVTVWPAVCRYSYWHQQPRHVCRIGLYPAHRSAALSQWQHPVCNVGALVS